MTINRTQFTAAALTVALAALVGCTNPSHVDSALPKAPVMTSEQLRDMRAKGEKIVVLDVREENEFKEVHITEAVWFPKSKFDKKDAGLRRTLAGLDKGTPVVTYCGAGHRSAFVARKLRAEGFDARNLEGISFWRQKGFPVVRGPKLPPSMRPATIHLQEAYEHYYLKFKDVFWIDVRHPSDFAVGRVKGSVNIPVTKIADNLSRIPRDKEVVIYCEGTWRGGLCGASYSAARILIKHGYSPGKIKVFEDGYGWWVHKRYPSESDSLLEILFGKKKEKKT